MKMMITPRSTCLTIAIYGTIRYSIILTGSDKRVVGFWTRPLQRFSMTIDTQNPTPLQVTITHQMNWIKFLFRQMQTRKLLNLTERISTLLVQLHISEEILNNILDMKYNAELPYTSLQFMRYQVHIYIPHIRSWGQQKSLSCRENVNFRVSATGCVGWSQSWTFFRVRRSLTLTEKKNV